MEQLENNYGCFNQGFNSRVSQKAMVANPAFRQENLSNVSQPMVRNSSRGSMVREITVRSKTPTDSYSTTKKHADLQKNLLLSTVGG